MIIKGFHIVILAGYSRVGGNHLWEILIGCVFIRLKDFSKINLYHNLYWNEGERDLPLYKATPPFRLARINERSTMWGVVAASPFIIQPGTVLQSIGRRAKAGPPVRTQWDQVAGGLTLPAAATGGRRIVVLAILRLRGRDEGCRETSAPLVTARKLGRLVTVEDGKRLAAVAQHVERAEIWDLHDLFKFLFILSWVFYLQVQLELLIIVMQLKTWKLYLI